ncbi:MAG TPA: glycosyltransferase [Chthoniobacterales bacterium]
MSITNRILVVTPTLGESAFLDETLQSVASQPLNILHVLAVPAGKVEALKARYPGTIVVPDAGKEGAIYGALNAALNAVPEGWDWFTYINDDDLLLPGFGEMALRHFRRRRPEPVTYGDVELIDDAGGVLGHITVERSPKWIPALLQEGISPLMQQGMLFRRDVVKRLVGFDQRYRLCADLDFWLRAYASGAAFRNYATRVARFRVRSGQLSGNTELTQREQDMIVARNLPIRRTAIRRALAVIRYRLANLPRYLARVRSRGFQTSYQILEGGGAA